jgi:uncharacterized protein (TIGR03000 family)
MYSLVLMTAFAAGAEAPACHHCYTSCHGCYSSCYGCCGYSSCYSCCGYSSCYGCCGYSACYGCSGCYSSCYGCYSSCYGCGGCYGSYSGCTGCYGCYGTYSPYMIITPPVGTPVETVPAPKKDAGKMSKARLILDVPTEATLYIDDQPMKSTATRRTFSTPPLEAGVTYYYVLRAEVAYNGKTYTETKRVLVRRGEEVKASFGELEESLAAAKTAVQVGAR